MAKNYVTQEVYDALKGIASDKNEYEYLKSVGATTDAEGYREAAKPKYNVVLNYDKNLGNTLSGMNSVQAKDLINNYAVARDEKAILGDISLGKYGWSNSTTDADRNKFATNTAQYYDELAAVNPQLADVVRGWDYGQLNSYITTGQMPEIKKPTPPPAPKQRTIWDVANEIVGYKQGYEGGKKVGVEGYGQNHFDAQPLYAELESMGEEGKAMAARLRGSNASEAMAYITANKPIDPKTPEQIATGNNTFLTAQGQRGLDAIYDMYNDKSFGQEIRDKFTAYGGAMGNQAAAGAAAANGGNLDSFAEFNKNATNLGYQLAGENAIQNKRSGFANDYFNTGYRNVADALNANAVDYYDYVLGQNQIYSDEKKAQWAKEAEIYGYDVDKYIAEKEAELQNKIADSDTALEWAKLGRNPDGTVMEGAVPQGTVPQGTVPLGTVPLGTLGSAYLDGSTISKTLGGGGSVAKVVKNDGKGDTGNIKGGNGNGGAGNEVVKPVVKSDEVINPAVEGEDDGDELPTNVLRNTNEAEAHIDLQINAGMDKRSAVIQAAQMLSQGGRPDLAYDICQKYGVDVQSYTEWMGNH